ncbi:DUF5677 domain-containing protein [Luteimonas sp. BDR2-5]|uniref:DUF5677 domain-containing protein n=1 Tax=Proluteimonas luteida TaxID=2878685 RepID=UPI001E555637|nr:DUF5677 domain-containing protein [Luteimonas sp. BDR2-5]MCD9026607.1 DUF5677 domain-containing protein [Luteimonas sp. BDR2-5]
MDTLHRELVKVIEGLAKQAKRKGLSDDQLEQVVEREYPRWLEEMSQILGAELQARSKEMLAEEKANARGFENRNKRRWKLPLDQLRVMIRVIEESAESLVVEWNDEHRDDPCTFAALNNLCVKSLLLAREIICLIEGGFADGALARWRTLHETAVIAFFVAHHDELTAERYIASFSFKAKSAMHQMNQYADRSGLGKFSDQELEQAERDCSAMQERLGKGLGEDYGWAREALGKEKGKVTLVDIERDTGLDHWRPRVRWSSQNVHAGYRPPLASLGMSEAELEGHLTGASNSGMVDPIHMTAISLHTAGVAFLTTWPNADRLVVASIVGRISQDIGPLAMDVEAKSAKRAKARRRSR